MLDKELGARKGTLILKYYNHVSQANMPGST